MPAWIRRCFVVLFFVMALLPGTGASIHAADEAGSLPSMSSPPLPPTWPAPFEDPYRASLMYALLNGSDANARLERIQLFPERRKIPVLGARTDFRFSFYPTRPGAPLVILFPGLGGFHREGAVLFAANLYNRAGYNVLSVPSTMNWSFALSASATGIPGLAADDAEDMYSALVKALRHVKVRYRTRFGRIGIAGFSLGAMDSAWVTRLDRERKELGISAVLMVNPPVDTLHGVSVLDSLDRVGSTWDREYKDRIRGYAIGYYLQIMQRFARSAPDFEAILRDFDLSSEQIRWLVGDSFHESIKDTILASQQVNDLGILKTPLTRYHWDARTNEAASLTYRDYMERFVLPTWALRHGVPADPTEMLKGTGLRPLEKFLREEQYLRVLHSMNDFLLQSQDLEFLRVTLGPKLKVYPLGGHGGYLWQEETIRDLLAAMAPLNPTQ